MLVVGAGAVGAYYAALLSKKYGDEVLLFATPGSASAIARNGVIVRSGGRSESVRVQVTDEPTTISAARSVMLCTKMYDLETVLKQLRTPLRKSEAVFGLQNGIEKEELIRGYLSAEPLYATTYVSTEKVAPGVIEYIDDGSRVLLGERSGERTERVGRIARMLNASGISCEVPHDPLLEVWCKFAGVCAINGVCAAARCNSAQASSYEPTRRLMLAALEEGFRVAAAHGHRVPKTRQSRHRRAIRTERSPSRPSTFVDAVMGRRTEIEYLNGALIRKARQRGVPVPANEFIYAVVSSPKDLT